MKGVAPGQEAREKERDKTAGMDGGWLEASRLADTTREGVPQKHQPQKQQLKLRLQLKLQPKPQHERTESQHPHPEDSGRQSHREAAVGGYPVAQALP